MDFKKENSVRYELSKSNMSLEQNVLRNIMTIHLIMTHQQNNDYDSHE